LPKHSANRLPFRWWPGAAILVLVEAAVTALWSPQIPNRDQSVMWSVITLSTSPILILLWLLAFSRLPVKHRLLASGGFILFLGILFSLIRITGVSGDFVPTLGWRIGSAPDVDQVSSTASKSGTDSKGTTPRYPQFLGPDRNAKLPDVHLETDWEIHPPRLLWRQPIGAGWSAFAVSGQFAVTQEQHGEEEQVVAYDLTSGKVRWRHSDRAAFRTTTGGDGPRATPTISADRVYTYGATGILNCLELDTGDLVWTSNTLEENGAKITDWGMAGSPLVLGEKVIVSPGGPGGKSLVAYHKDTGAFLWGGGDTHAGYSSPSLGKIAGTDQILIFNKAQISAHVPETGRVLWQFPWEAGFTIQHVAQPLPLPGDLVLASTGYGIGSVLLHIASNDRSELSASVVWRSPRLQAKFTNFVHRDGYIYGLDNGRLACLDVKDGQRKWKQGRYGHGQLILVDDILLILGESGEVILVDANPEGFNERARFQAIEGKTWNNPALAGKYLLVRNSREAACYEVNIKAELE